MGAGGELHRWSPAGHCKSSEDGHEGGHSLDLRAGFLQTGGVIFLMPMARRKLTKPRTSEEAFAFAAEHAKPCMDILDPLFAKDPIRTTVCFFFGVAGWSLLMERAMALAAVEYSEQCEAESTCSI